MKRLLKVIALVCICFLVYMIVGHLFGEENQALNNKELLALLLFPTSILVGLTIALWRPVIGGFIGSLAMTLFFIIYPEVISNWYFLIPSLTAFLMMVTSLNHKKRMTSRNLYLW